MRNVDCCFEYPASGLATVTVCLAWRCDGRNGLRVGRRQAESNERKHGVAFTEAMTVFADPLSVTGYDTKHADEEDRFLTMGISAEGRLLVVSHTDRGDAVRIISAREAVRRERKDYEDGNFP